MDVDALFASASSKKSKVQDVDAFWDDAVEKTGNIPTNPDVITFDRRAQTGIEPGRGRAQNDSPLRQTGSLKKK